MKEGILAWATLTTAAAAALAVLYAASQLRYVQQERLLILIERAIQWGNKVKQLYFDKSTIDALAEGRESNDEDFNMNEKARILLFLRGRLHELNGELVEISPTLAHLSKKYPSLEEATKKLSRKMEEHDKILAALTNIMKLQSIKIEKIEIQMGEGVFDKLDDEFIRRAGKILRAEEKFWVKVDELVKHNKKLAEEAAAFTIVAAKVKLDLLKD